MEEFHGQLLVRPGRWHHQLGCVIAGEDALVVDVDGFSAKWIYYSLPWTYNTTRNVQRMFGTVGETNKCFCYDHS